MIRRGQASERRYCIFSHPPQSIHAANATTNDDFIILFISRTKSVTDPPHNHDLLFESVSMPARPDRRIIFPSNLVSKSALVAPIRPVTFSIINACSVFLAILSIFGLSFFPYFTFFFCLVLPPLLYLPRFRLCD
ncbi:hypothetical protein BDN70DRAFT_403008 [Pholiota conissans]|uniref:Uncharacterized protein n=1 Tax=Pholiota conissans TaxID=109636 RepID=A0A9P5Z778_9AGAR|nr:hypothetical protein BDN70DRAFT_403008 [Pholiota conissans]